MKIGDPRKTAIVGLVAIAAVGFCVKQLIGGSNGPRILRDATQTQATSSAQVPAMVASLQLDRLRIDPFSHPKLSAKAPGHTLAGEISSPPSARGTSVAAGTSEGSPLPGPLKIGPGIDTSDARWPAGPTGVRPDGATAQVEKLTRLTLKAVVKVSQRIAYLSVDGQEARGFRAGDLVKDGIEVAAVADDSITLKSNKSTVTLRVGQQGDL